MPEGDTVFKLAAYLAPQLQDRRLVAGLVRTTATLDLAGCRVGGVFAHGKHLFIELDDQRLLRSHLGMWGSWHAYAPREPWQKPRRQAAIVLDTGERLFVCFNPLQVEVLRQGGVRRRRLEVALGPDLLAATLDLPAILARVHALGRPDTPLVDLLLDQRIATGIGNVYKSEVLFVERLDPRLTLAAVDDDRVHGVYRSAARLLSGNVRGGPRVTRRAGDEAGRLWVYGRGGRPCLLCDQPVLTARLGKARRSTFWCPSCQRPPA